MVPQMGYFSDMSKTGTLHPLSIFLKDLACPVRRCLEKHNRTEGLVEAFEDSAKDLWRMEGKFPCRTLRQALRTRRFKRSCFVSQFTSSATQVRGRISCRRRFYISGLSH